MSRTLITDSDQAKVIGVLTEKIKDFKCEYGITWQHETELLLLTMTTDIPHEKIREMYHSQISPALEEARKACGEFDFAFYALCKCGRTAQFFEEDIREEEELDFRCDACILEELDRQAMIGVCRVCDKEFDVQKDIEWHLNCQVYVGPFNRRGAIGPVINIKDHIFDGSTEKEFCCSRKCAKKAFRKWLKELLDHPFTKDCLVDS